MRSLPPLAPVLAGLAIGMSSAPALAAGPLGPEQEPAAPAPAERAVPLERTAAWAILSEGRIKPLETFARETLLALAERDEIEGLGPLEVVWGLHLASEDFSRRAILRVHSEELKTRAGLDPDQRRFSLEALMQDRPFQEIVEEAMARERAGARLDALEREALTVYARMERAAALVRGDALTLVPSARHGAGWVHPQALLEQGEPGELEIYGAFGRLAAAYRSADAAAFEREVDALGALLRAAGGETYPSGRELSVELFYNRLGAFGRAWKLYLAAFLAFLFVRIWSPRAARGLGLATLLAGLVLHTLGLGLRWAIAGRAPVSDMYESLVFMGWGVVAVGVVLELLYRRGHFGPAASLLAFASLAFAENLPLDSAINPLAPVLANTAWLSVHVMTIMLSYSAFALAMAMGHVVLAVRLFRPGRSETLLSLSRLLYKTLQVGVLFLAAGICFGAIWANESWGRYWGWDPKETWSLITFFAYLALVHARFAGWLHDFGLAVTSIAGFMFVLMTYYGVNFVLGAGLHSYGFAEGGTLYAVAYLVLELAVIAAALARHRSALVSFRAPAAALDRQTVRGA